MAMFENFPYTDMHNLNLDWIIKIAKDFLDQYTTIQNIISQGIIDIGEKTDTGLQELQDKYDNLESLLQEWYNTHSEDIANQLASALADLQDWYDTHSNDIASQLASAISSFNTAADAKEQAVIESIPDDYTTFSNSCVKSSNILVTSSNISEFNNANNFTPNTIIMINAAIVSSVANIPQTGTCTIITTGWYKGAFNRIPYGGEIQIYIPHSNHNTIKARSYDGETWSDWNDSFDALFRNSIQSSGVLVTSSNVSNYNNCNTYPHNKVILVMGNALSSISNKPYDDIAFTIITTGWYGGEYTTYPYGGLLQIAIPMWDVYHPIKYRVWDGEQWYGWRDNSNIFHANTTNFMDVIDIANTIPNSIVILNPGSYPLFTSERNETYWKNRRPATRYCGIILKNNIKIIGDGRVTFVANYSGTDEDIKENFSVFNIAGSAHIENINITCSNICYAIHDDSLIVNSVQNNLVIKNCNIYHGGSDHTFVNGSPICYGAGSTRAGTREITGNIMRASADLNTMSIHSTTDGYSYYNISGNVMNGRLHYNPFGTGGTVDIILSNNKMGADVDVSSETGLTLHKFNNVIE